MDATTEDATTELQELQATMERTLARMRELHRERAGRAVVEDLELLDADGRTVRLSDLFGASDELLIVHNMGTGCTWCSMWADGLSGLYEQVASRAPLVMVSRDEPAVQQEVRARRGWRQPMYSTPDGAVHRALGFQEGESVMPGYSSLRREPGGTIVHVASDWFGPGDLYNAAWPMFELLDRGVADWQPLATDRPAVATP